MAGLEDELAGWIEEQIRAGRPAHARGYQGRVYLYEAGGERLIVKVATGPAWLRALRQVGLRREHRVYQQLIGFSGSPRCLGLLRNRYLVLEYIEGVSLRTAPPVDREGYYATLLELIQELHRRGVAHADLKRKDNLLVVNGRQPYVIDFGAAIVRKPGFAPINHYLYNLARQFDLNAWVKLKHGRKFASAPAAERAQYRQTRVERIARRLKPGYEKIKDWLRHGSSKSKP